MRQPNIKNEAARRFDWHWLYKISSVLLFMPSMNIAKHSTGSDQADVTELTHSEQAFPNLTCGWQMIKRDFLN